jgi:hypothetical protein
MSYIVYLLDECCCSSGSFNGGIIQSSLKCGDLQQHMSPSLIFFYWHSLLEFIMCMCIYPSHDVINKEKMNIIWRAWFLATCKLNSIVRKHMRMDILQFQRLLWNIRLTLIRKWKLLWKKKIGNHIKTVIRFAAKIQWPYLEFRIMLWTEGCSRSLWAKNQIIAHYSCDQ